MRYFFVFTCFIFISSFSFGQKTPDELGILVFKIFKHQDTLMLDTMTPSCELSIERYKKFEPKSEFINDTNFCQKYYFHDRRFKNKCIRIMLDTTDLKVDWKKVKLIKISYTENKVNNNDSISSKNLSINLLDIYLSYKKLKYLLQFKGIYKYNNIWKLGSDLRLRKI